MIKRKRDTIKVLDTTSDAKQLAKGLQCSNCKERHYFVIKQGDANNAFCTNCGHVTPLRQMKQSRGLTIPSIQQLSPALVQSKKDPRRKLQGINRKVSELEKSVTEKGYTIIESQTIDTTR